MPCLHSCLSDSTTLPTPRLKRRHGDTDGLHEAKGLFNKCLIGFESSFGENDERTLTVVNHLAGVMDRLGRVDEAEALFRRALAGRETTLGKNHPDTMITG